MEVIVKFTQQYSEDAHQFCANTGAAPKLLGFCTLAAGWYMAVMEYLGPEVYHILDIKDASDASLVMGIQEVVKTLHSGGFVHGDIWPVNMMTCHVLNGPEDVQDVFLIDFDWAGLDGTVQYPPNLNRETTVT